MATVPPLFAAGLRFVFAGGALYLWACLQGGPTPSRLEWRNVTILSVFLFLISYGAVFWAEQRVPSGVVSVLVAMIPVWTALLQIVVFRKERFRWSLPISIVLGVSGVVLLAFDPVGHLNRMGALIALLGSISWSVGTALSKMLTLPKSMTINSGAQMLLGGLMLLLCSGGAGELTRVPRVSVEAGLAILYLSVAGSIVAYTAYIWLLNTMRATVVTSYAYVNPVVALLVGHWFGHETLGLRTLTGAGLVLVSVVVVMLLD